MLMSVWNVTHAVTTVTTHQEVSSVHAQQDLFYAMEGIVQVGV